MSAEAAGVAFEPYFSTKETGVGLGLALVSRIVEGHGGRVALDSTPGHGTSIRLLLPVRAPVALESAKAPEARA
jgi:signal transduction histidine kinase